MKGFRLRRRGLAFLVSGLVLASGLLAACQTGPGSSTGPAQQGGKQAAEEIKVGVAQSLTGTSAPYGNSAVQGIQLAADEINATGGINGKPLKLIVKDTATDKAQAISVFEQLIKADKVLALIGPTASNDAFAASPIAQENKTLNLVTVSTAKGIPEIGDHIFRNSMPDDIIVPHLIRTAKEKLGIKKVVILYASDDQFATGYYKLFDEALKKEGVQVLATEAFSKTDTDYKAILAKVKPLQPDALVVSHASEAAAQLMVQAQTLGIQARVIGNNIFNSPKLLELAGPAAEGALVGSSWFLGDPRPANQKFIQAYKAKYSKDPDQFAAQSYDGMKLLAAAIAKANTATDRKAVRDAMAQMQFDGVMGALSFGANRQAEMKPVVLEAAGGKFQVFGSK